MKRLIIAIPDEGYRSELSYVFQGDGYEIIEAKTIREVLRHVAEGPVSMLLVDMNYSDGSGLELIEKVRENSQAPIIVITAVAEDLNKVLALEYGADDFLVKPFNILELKARMRSIMRRTQSTTLQDAQMTMQVGELHIQIIGRMISYEGVEFELTGREMDLLLVMAQEPEKVFTRLQLAEAIWGEDYIGDIRAIDVHIKRIRRKFLDNKIKNPPVATQWGEGYFLRSS